MLYMTFKVVVDEDHGDGEPVPVGDAGRAEHIAGCGVSGEPGGEVEHILAVLVAEPFPGQLPPAVGADPGGHTRGGQDHEPRSGVSEKATRGRSKIPVR